VVEEVAPEPEPEPAAIEPVVEEVVPPMPEPEPEPVVEEVAPPPMPEPEPEPVVEEVAPEPVAIEPEPTPETVAPQPVPAAPAPPTPKPVGTRKGIDLSGFRPVGGINVNTATLQELVERAGIKEFVARRILAYREAHGPFVSIFGVADVPGVSRRRFKEITGMPYSGAGHHRAERLMKMLDLTVDEVCHVPTVAERVVEHVGLKACVVSDNDGLILADVDAGSIADRLAALAPHLMKKIGESTRLVDFGQPSFATISVKARMITVAHAGPVYISALHRSHKVTQKQYSTIRKVADEVGWLLGNPLYAAS
jgi:predicted regulator of Ras-like GTPase activity (Roadblock/LC7/MglB family)